MAVVLIAVAMPALLVPPVGEFPYNDDFDYAATVWHLVDTGRLVLSDWPAMTLVGHVGWGSLFTAIGGKSYACLRMSMFAISAVAALALYGFCRSSGCGRAFAVLVALVFAADPITVALEYSFMTDVTGAALATSLLALQPRNNRLPGWTCLAYGVLGGLAYLTRDIACVPFLAFAAVLAVRAAASRATWRPVLIMLLTFAAIALTYRFWLYEIHGVPFNRLQGMVVSKSFGEYVRRAAQIGTCLAFHTLPLAVFAAPAIRWDRSTVFRVITILTFVLVVLGSTSIWSTWPAPYSGDLFDMGLRPPELPTIPPESLRGPRIQIGATQFSLMQVITTGLAGASAFVLSIYLVQTWRQRPTRAFPERSLVPALSLVMTLGLLEITGAFYDRYVLALVPIVLVGFAGVVPAEHVRRRASLWAGFAAVVVVGAASAFGIQDGMARSRVFWGIVDSLHREGVDPAWVDAGVAYGGQYRFTPTYRGPRHVGPYLGRLSDAQRSIAIAAFSPLTSDADRPIAVTFARKTGYTVVQAHRFDTWLRTGEVYVLVRHDDGDGHAPAGFTAWRTRFHPQELRQEQAGPRGGR